MDQLANFESQIKMLWEKAQQTGALIAKLREERTSLQTQNQALNREVAKLRADLMAREQQILKHATNQATHDTKSAATISNGEREQLTAKVKELLARIDAYL